jgi:hypothetical protein
MDKIVQFIRGNLVSIAIIAFLLYGTFGVRQVDTYTKDGVIVALAADGSSMNAIGATLKMNRWRHNGRCTGDCFQLIVSFDEESGVYIIISARDKKAIEYLSSPTEVLQWLGATQKTIPM